jgi:hypothetical protein
VKKTRQNKKLGPGSDFISTERLHGRYFTREEEGQLDGKAGFRFASALWYPQKIKNLRQGIAGGFGG